jgi:Domain of unknown function (DUF932)
MTSKLMVHCGGIRRTRDELATLHTPSPTSTWRPVPHSELVASLLDGLAVQGVEVVREDYCTLGRDDAKLLGTLDLRISDLDSPDYSMGLGLRAANDKSLAIQFVAACRVFVCDNWAFSGSDGAVFLKRKHTARLNLRAIVPSTVEQFLERAGAFRLDIDRMKDHDLPDGRAKVIMHDAFAAGLMPLRLFPIVSSLYFDDEAQAEKFPDRTLWSLNNAMTEALKRLRPAPQQVSGLKVGRMFGRLVHHKRPELVAVIDGVEVWDRS